MAWAPRFSTRAWPTLRRVVTPGSTGSRPRTIRMPSGSTTATAAGVGPGSLTARPSDRYRDTAHRVPADSRRPPNRVKKGRVSHRIGEVDRTWRPGEDGSAEGFDLGDVG